MRIMSAAVLAVGLVAAGVTGASAQNWPERPITLVVPFNAGGSTDAIGRFAAAGLSKGLGQQVVVENVNGANGGVGTTQVKNAAPDGYTLLLGSSGVLIINPQLNKDLTYTIDDFTPMAPINSITSIAIISNKLHEEGKINTFQDLVAYAKAHPGELNFGSGGIGNGGHLAGENLKAQAGIEMEHIPFSGGAAATTALIAGDIDLIFSTTPESLPPIRANQVWPLAVMAPERLETLPDLPTISEQGVNNAETRSWFGIFGPKGVPADIVAKVEKAMNEALQTPEAKTFFDNLSMNIMAGTSADLVNTIETDTPRLTDLAQNAAAQIK